MRPFKRKKDPTQERAQQTVESILQAVVELVDQRDPDSLTTNRIAERAGVSIGSLYQYFPGKEAIFSSLIEWYMRKEMEFIVTTLGAQSQRSLEEAVDEMLSKIIEMRRKNLKLEQTLMGFFVRTGDFEVFKNYDQKMLAGIDAALEEATARGIVKNKTDVTAYLLLHLIRSTMFATTASRPELYDQPQDLKNGLRKVIMALLA